MTPTSRTNGDRPVTVAFRVVDPDEWYVVGVDAGGTSTRCVLADRRGDVVARSHGPGLNQFSSGSDARSVLDRAVREALAGRPPTAVAGGVLAVAGAGSGLELAERDARAVWRSVGLGGSPVVVPDVVATFAGATTEAGGVVLVAGTGAIAAAVRGTQVVRRADGHGWLLGDVGSAVWLGREAVSAVLDALDGTAAATALREGVLRALDDATDAQEVVRAVHSAPPARLGSLAPLVTEQAVRGDDVAAGIVARGVAGLVRSYDAVTTDEGGPTVLGGALLTVDGPVRDLLLDALHRRGVHDVRTTTDATVGAVRLALALHDPGSQER